MKKYIHTLAIAVVLAVTPALHASVTISHADSGTTGVFQSSTGATLLAGGLSIGFFTTNGGAGPSNSAFGTTIVDWASMLSSGWHDVREFSASNPDWNYPTPVAGSVASIPIGSLPAGDQLYLVCFNAGSYNISTPSQSFVGATEWGVAKDGLSPADLGTKTVNLSVSSVFSVTPLEGTQSGVNMNLTPLVPVPEPTTVALGVLAGFAGLGVRRRQRN